MHPTGQQDRFPSQDKHVPPQFRSVRIVPVLPVIDKFHTIVFRRFVMHFDDLQTGVTPCALITRQLTDIGSSSVSRCAAGDACIIVCDRDDECIRRKVERLRRVRSTKSPHLCVPHDTPGATADRQVAHHPIATPLPLLLPAIQVHQRSEFRASNAAHRVDATFYYETS